MNKAYTVFARVYDELMAELPYGEWCDFLTAQLARFGITEGLVAELGCGTGLMTELLAMQGFDMIGIDNAEDMLAEAMEKRTESGLPILYLQQDMRAFELYGTVRAIVSVCDTFNYLKDTAELEQVLRLADNYLDPGGILLFDLKTDAYFRRIGQDTFAEAGEDVSYIWENSYEEESRTNGYYLSLFFAREDGLYERCDEYHEQHAFLPEEIKAAVAAAGLKLIGILDGKGRAASAKSERIYVLAQEQKKGNNKNE